MKYSGSLYVIKDKETTKKFYNEVLGLHVIVDFGANFTMTGGICFQTKESWVTFIDKEEKEIQSFSNNSEIYFEEKNLDGFVEKLASREDIIYLHPLKTQDWGQRCIRFYDPDGHIIEVGEELAQVCKRYFQQGMSIEEIAKQTTLSIKMVQKFLLKSR